MQADVEGLVWQTVAVIGSLAFDRTTLAVKGPAAPILSEAITNNPVPLGPPVWAKPSLVGVSPTAITSGTGVRRNGGASVSTPTMTGAPVKPSQIKLNCTFAG